MPLESSKQSAMDNLQSSLRTPQQSTRRPLGHVAMHEGRVWVPYITSISFPWSLGEHRRALKVGPAHHAMFHRGKDRIQ